MSQSPPQRHWRYVIIGSPDADPNAPGEGLLVAVRPEHEMMLHAIVDALETVHPGMASVFAACVIIGANRIALQHARTFDFAIRVEEIMEFAQIPTTPHNIEGVEESLAHLKTMWIHIAKPNGDTARQMLVGNSFPPLNTSIWSGVIMPLGLTLPPFDGPLS